MAQPNKTNKKKPLARAIQVGTAQIAGVSLLSAALLAGPVAAQNTDDKVVQEEVIVTGTGSAIERANLESALPIDIITRQDIERSGLTTTSDLLARHPAMQGFITPSDSAGGGGGGTVTANLRALGDEYTLVLLNGRRMAPSDSGSAIDLSNIPISAIERIEILTDGASALYGSDAIAGVVNIILKEHVESSTFTVRADLPFESGGESSGFDFTTGFGSADDPFNITLSYSHFDQKQLAASDRDFARTGMITFNHPDYDQDLYFFNGSGNAIPGNARVRYMEGGEEVTRVFNPYSASNGSCAPNTSAIGDECWFDYTSTIEVVPETERNSFYANMNFDLGENVQGFATAQWSNQVLTARIAPYPTGWMRLPNDSDVVVDNVLPHLTADQAANITTVDGRWRALPGGNRTTEYDTTSTNLLAGLKAEFGDLKLDGAVTHTNTEIVQNYPTGWLIRDAFVAAAGSGAFNIFAPAGEFSDADRDALAPTVYSGHWETSDITVTAFDMKGSMPVFDMSGGSAQIALGFDYRDTTYDRVVAEANANEELLFLSTDTPYELQRSQHGVFTEIWMPFTDSWELTASLRYDSVGAVNDKLSGAGEINDEQSETTYKINTKWDVSENLTLRASYGTGFKMPTLRQIGEPLSDFGVTSGNYTCPFEVGDPLEPLCLSGESQYGVFREGYAELKPETSEQYSAGFVWEPMDDMSLTVDYWNIEMEDRVDRVQQAQIFENPTTYRDRFTSRLNQATQELELAIIQSALNIATSENSGFDYHWDYTQDKDWGVITTSLSGTVMTKADTSLYGSSLGQFGLDSNVVANHLNTFQVNISHDNLSHTISWHYRSGYADQAQTVDLLDESGNDVGDTDIQLDIPNYITVNWQSDVYLMDDDLKLTIGMNNVLDKEPHLSLRTEGSGHQVGWDPRYSDAYGRTLFLQTSFSF